MLLGMGISGMERCGKIAAFLPSARDHGRGKKGGDELARLVR